MVSPLRGPSESLAAKLMLLPSMRLTAYGCYAVAAMFVAFAVWAAFGFAFPLEPLPLALNVISKILCFVAVIMLFVWKADAPPALVGGQLMSGAGHRVLVNPLFTIYGCFDPL